MLKTTVISNMTTFLLVSVYQILLYTTAQVSEEENITLDMTTDGGILRHYKYNGIIKVQQYSKGQILDGRLPILLRLLP